MAKKKKIDTDPFLFFNFEADRSFPQHVLLIVDKEKKLLIVLDAAKMDKWGEFEASPQ